MEVNYIIVGLGIAGLSVCEELRKRGKSFVIFDEGSKNATAASGGIINPTILKRFTTPWKTELFHPRALEFYQKLQKDLNENIFSFTVIDRIFSSIEEQNNWIVASDKEKTKDYLKSEFLESVNPNVIAPLGLGEVEGSVQLNIRMLLQCYRKKLESGNQYFQEIFDYSLINSQSSYVSYKGVKANYIVLCEGPTVKENPFFPQEAVVGNKGEYIIIEAPELNLARLIKGNHYIIPLGESKYKVGATFDVGGSTWNTTEYAKDFLTKELQRMISCPFKVIGQTAGIRATTKDHKPILGTLRDFPRYAFFNGLGTRGLMMAPLLAEILMDNIEEELPIPEEISINRFLK